MSVPILPWALPGWMSPLELILPGLGCPLELLLRPSIYHPSHLLESIRPKKILSEPNIFQEAKNQTCLINYSTPPLVPSIARLLSAVRYCSVAATSSIRYCSRLWNWVVKSFVPDRYRTAIGYARSRSKFVGGERIRQLWFEIYLGFFCRITVLFLLLFPS